MNLMQMNEQEQWEAIKNWFKSHGFSFFFMILIAVSIVFGWRYWQQTRQQARETASVLYDRLLMVGLTPDTHKLADDMVKDLQQNYDTTPYASFAGLLAARIAVEKQDLTAAQQQLQWVIDHAKIPYFRQLAQLRMARILQEINQSQAALQQLASVNDPALTPLMNQVKGDILMAQNKNSEAKMAYRAALSAISANDPMYDYLKMRSE